MNLKSALHLLFIIVTFQSFGQMPSYFQYYTIKDGLADNYIKSIKQDKRGFLWIATPNGISRYDGYTFTNYYHDDKDSTSLPGNNLVCIAEDKDGNMWFSFHGGLAKYDYHTKKFMKVNIDFEKGFDKPHHIFCDSKNRIWISSWLGHYVCDTNGKLIKHWRKGKGPREYPHDHSAYTYEDTGGRIWISTGDGLCLLNESTWDFTVYRVSNPPYTLHNGWLNDMMKVIEDGKGNFWLGGWANGLRHFSPGSGKFEAYLPTPEFAGEGAFNVISDLAFFDGHLWVSCDKGLGVFDTVGKKFSFLRPTNIEGFPVPYDGIKCLYVSGPVMWVGTERGLYKLDLRHQFFEVFNLKGLKEGSCLPDLSDIAAFPVDRNKLMVPTWTCGIFELDLTTGVFEKFGPPLHTEDVYRKIDFKSVVFDSRGVIWLPSSHGLFRVSNGVVSRIIPYKLPADMPRENYFNVVREDHNGNVWAGSLDGILLFPQGRDSYTKLKLSSIDSMGNPVSDYINDIAIAPNGDIWFLRGEDYEGRKIGFTIYRHQNNTFETHTVTQGKLKDYPFAFAATAIVVDYKNRCWVTSPRGVIRFNGATFSEFKILNQSNGLLADNTSSITLDSYGNVWIASLLGLSRISIKDDSIRNFTLSDGLPAMNITSLTAGRTGELYVGFKREVLAVYRPRKIDAVLNERPELVSAILDNNSLRLSDTLAANYNFNYLKLLFSPFNYLPPEENTFDIEILHNGKLTSYSSKSNELMLSGLAPGMHEIRIFTRNNFVNRSIPAVVFFMVKPAFWQTKWFIVLLLLTTLVAVISIAQYRFKRLKEEAQRKSDLDRKISAAEMNALRSQMNPHFVFNALNAVHHFIWDKKPEEASEYLTKFSRLTRLVLENSRQQNVKLSDDLKILKYYLELEELNLEHGLDYILEIADDINPEHILIPPMILQPLIENCLKHGLKNLPFRGILRISIQKKGDELKCIIEDNGTGRKSSRYNPNHRSLGSGIIIERLSVINSLYRCNARLIYIDKKDAENNPCGTIAELYLPLIIDN